MNNNLIKNLNSSELQRNLSDSKMKMPIKSKKYREEELRMEEIIDNLSNEITKNTLNENGEEIYNIKFPKSVNLKEIIKYILEKEVRKKNYIILLRYYLTQFQSLLETINLSNKFYETKEIVNKIAMYIKREEIKKDKVIFYNGQIGKTFYIILEGEVSVLIPNEFNVEITPVKYLNYLKYLYNLNEYELLKLSYESNKKIINEVDYEFADILKNFDYCLDKCLSLNYKMEEISVESYINRFLFFDSDRIFNKSESENNKKSSNYEFNNFEISNSFINKNNKNINDLPFINRKYRFTLWKYAEVIKLGEGKCFGEIALQRERNKRTATVITLTDCLLGILQKDEYQSFMKKVMEKTRRNNIERLLNTKLFYGLNYHTFDTKLYNYFIFTKERKGDFMFKRGDKRTTLYYIKKGEIQLEINATCKQLDDIIMLIGGNPENRALNNLIKTNEKLMEFINIPKKFNISIYSQGDIIGTDEIIYLNSNKLNIEQLYTNLIDLSNISNSFSYNEFENSFLFNGIYMTNCDIFKVDLHFLKNMINDNRLIKDNYEKMTRNKRERLIERLLTIKTNTILQYYNLINHKKNTNYLNNISNEFNSKNNLLFLLNKKKVTNNNQLFLRKNICINESQFKNENNKINPQSPLNSNSRNTYFYGNKYKTKELFYPEPINNKLNSESNYMNERALLTSYMNNNKVKVKFDRKLFLKENSSLHKIKSEGMLLLSKNKMINDYNSFQNKMSLVKNNFKMRNTLANFIDNSNSNNEDNLSKNNSSDKMSTYKSNKSFFPNKKLKKIRNDILPNNLKIQTLKIINNKRIPKLLIKNALIYSEAIDKLLIKEQKKNIFKNTLLKNKNKNNINFIDKYKKNKIFNTLDVLVFDDILNNIKNDDRFQNIKTISPINGVTKNRNRFKINPLLHRTASYLLMKKK